MCKIVNKSSKNMGKEKRFYIIFCALILLLNIYYLYKREYYSCNTPSVIIIRFLY